MSAPNVAVLFECSRMVASAFEAEGWNAVSVDLRPAERTGDHWQGDVFDFVRTPAFDRADVVIWHYTCTYVCGSGFHWNYRVPGRNLMTEWSLRQIAQLREIIRGKRSCMENPHGVISKRLSWPGTQTVQPYHHGDDASKATVLRLDGLDPIPTPPESEWAAWREVEWPRGSGKVVRRWANQTDSGQNALPPTADRWSKRSETYPGIARAMARHWTKAPAQFAMELAA